VAIRAPDAPVSSRTSHGDFILAGTAAGMNLPPAPTAGKEVPMSTTILHVRTTTRTSPGAILAGADEPRAGAVPGASTFFRAVTTPLP
jgi:hypothetical protein